jgi:hypothetical protein
MTDISNYTFWKADRLFQRDSSFENFDSIDEDTYIRVDQEAERFKKYLPELSKQNSGFSGKLRDYVAILNYLIAPNVHFKLKSYDERILFLILTLDPDLNAFYTYIATQFPKKPTPIPFVKDTRDETEKKLDEAEYNDSVAIIKNAMISSIRDQIGTYDPHIIKYEEAYFNTFVKHISLVSDSKIDYGYFLSFMFNKVENFSSVSQERFEEINEVAQDYLSISDSFDYSTTLFHILRQRDLLHLRNKSEQLLFFILTLDPNLSILKTYSEAGNFGKLFEFMDTEFGFVSHKAWATEEFYRRKFAPDIELPFDVNPILR